MGYFTPESRVERWLGPECANNISNSFRDWCGPPVGLMGVPGGVAVGRGGEFVGPIKGGQFGNLVDFSEQRVKRIMRNFTKSQLSRLNMGFASLSDLISEATTGGKGQDLIFSKAGSTVTTAGNANILRNVGFLPAARGVGGTSGTGVKTTRSTTGALLQANATGGDTLHLTTLTAQCTAVNSIMLFDCLWDMTYNHATALSTAIDAANRPDRYQTSALAPGNFISSEITTALSATAHTITVTYVDQDGSTAEAAAAYSAAVSAVTSRTNTPAGTWFVTLNSPDTGARYLTNIAQSTITSVTGVSTFFIGHALALMPMPLANVPFIYDGINSAFNLVRIYDDACLSFMVPQAATASAQTFSGIIKLVSG